MHKFQKIPKVIHAWHWLGQHYDNWPREVQKYNINSKYISFSNDKENTLVIPTLEGEHIASIGDWIIQGIEGEMYPCKPNIFRKTYVKV